MILLIDARNSFVAFALAEAGSRELKAAWRLSAVSRSRDEWVFFFSQMLREKGFNPQQIQGAIVSSVVPQYTSVLVDAASTFLPAGQRALVLGPGVKSGLRIRTENPAELGSDLVCNAVAALQCCQPPCVIVDFNNALSFSALDSEGAFLGVAIAPGLQSASASLREAAAQLPQVRLDAVHTAIGKNTVDAMRAGLLLGWAGLCDRIIERMTLELGGSVTLIGTGIEESCPLELERSFTLWDPWLALKGLLRIEERNSARQGRVQG